jgi:hypothetical protein
MWRNRFGGGFEPVVRQNTEWMNEHSLCGKYPQKLWGRRHKETISKIKNFYT